MAKEPGISAVIIDKSQSVSTANLDTNIKTLVCVYAESGPAELTYVNNVTSFLNEFTANGRIEPGTHPTIVYAYTLLQETSLYIKRIGKQNVFPAVTCLGETVLLDKDNNLVQGEVLSLEAKNQAAANYWIETANNVYYAGNQTGLPAGKTKVKVSDTADIQELFGKLRTVDFANVYEDTETTIAYGKEIVKYSPNIAFLNQEINTGKYKIIKPNQDNMAINDYLFFGGYDFYFATGTVSAPENSTNPIPIGNPDFSADMPSILFLQRILGFDSTLNNQLNVTYETNAGAVSASNMIGISVNNVSLELNGNFKETNPWVKLDNHILYAGEEPPHTNETLVELSKDKEILSNDFMILLWDNIKETSLVDISAKGDIIIPVYSGLSIQQFGSTFETSYDHTAITYNYEFPLEEENASLVTHNDLHVQVNNILYYIGTPPKIDPSIIRVKVGNDKTSISEFVRLVERKLLSTFNCNKIKEGILFTEKVSTDNVDNRLKDSISPLSYSSNALFAVVQKFTSDVPKLRYNYASANDRFNVSVAYNGNSANYELSFNKGDVDGFGQTIYYDSERYENKYYKFVQIKENGKFLPIFESGFYGDQVKSAPFDNADIVQGIGDVFKEETQILWDIVTDSGIADPAIAKFISQLSTKEDINRNFQYYVSIPATYKTARDVSMYVRNLGLNNFKCSYLAAGYETVINGITFTMPGSMLALLSFFNLSASTGTIYCPGFGQKYGIVSSNSILQVFGEEDRKALLDDKVNTVKKVDGSPYFINDNLTSQQIKSLLSDTNNVRMVCVINNAVNQIIDQFIGELNTRLTRDNVTNVINHLLLNQIFKEAVFGPEGINVICDERNNTEQVLANNQLAIDIEVKFSATIKYIKVYSIILPLGNSQG